MSYRVRWNEERKKWEVQEKRDFGGWYLIQRTRLKEDAKKKASRLAEKDNAEAVFYSKDRTGNERVTYRRDFR